MNLILAAAELVRAEAERWALDMGYDAETLVTTWPATSFTFARLARRLGLDAEVACGDHVDCHGHFWALVAPRRGRSRRWESWGPAATVWGREAATLVDLTATQFDVAPRPRPARIVILPQGAPGRGDYILDDFGDELCFGLVWDRDKPEIEALTTRVMAAATRAGLVAPALVPEVEEA